jgi:hypothetical protein
MSAASGGLPFSTIEQKDDAAYIGQQQYFGLDPELLVISDAAAAAGAEDFFSETGRDLLAGIDWRTQFVLAVFQGWQGGAGYGVTVERITVEGARMQVEAVFLTPTDGPTGSVTSPYHLIAVRRPLAPLEGFSFELVVGENVVLTTTPP